MHETQLLRRQCSQTNSSIVLLQVFLEARKPFGMECKEVALEEKSYYKCWPAKCSSTSHLTRKFLTIRDPSISIPQTPSASQQPPLFPQSSQAQTSSQQTSSLPPDLAAQLASISGGLPGASGARGPREPTTSLSDVLDRSVLSRVLEMPGIGEQLRPGLPDNWDEDGSSVGEAVQSPQFQQVSPPPRYQCGADVIRHWARFRMLLVQDNLRRFCNSLGSVGISIVLRGFSGLWRNRFDGNKEEREDRLEKVMMMMTGCRRTREMLKFIMEDLMAQ